MLGWILITRIYSPNDLGILAVYISLLSIAVLVASWRYERAVLLPKDDVMAINLLVLCILIALIMSLALGAGVWLLGAEADSWDRLAGITPHLWLLPVGALVWGCIRHSATGRCDAQHTACLRGQTEPGCGSVWRSGYSWPHRGGR